MSLYFESIRVVRGRIMNLSEHQARVDRCVSNFCKNPKAKLSLKKSIQRRMIPREGIHKLRIQYDAYSAELTDIEISAYKEKEIHSLQLVDGSRIQYFYKAENREMLDSLYAKKNQSDDVLILRDNLLTDTWYCNIALHDGKEWFTPRTCLLPGTMRAKLLKNGVIKQADISIIDLKKYTKIRLFNAMIPWSNSKDIPIHKVYH